MMTQPRTPRQRAPKREESDGVPPLVRFFSSRWLVRRILRFGSFLRKRALVVMTLVSTVMTRRLDIQAACSCCSFACVLLGERPERHQHRVQSSSRTGLMRDGSLVVAYLKGRWGCARNPITPPVSSVAICHGRKALLNARGSL